MKNSDWPKEEIQRLAQTSGKPLEVVCAEAFLAQGWKARLGSHFRDGDTVRELDVLAERAEAMPGPTGMTVCVRALVSCKGFPLERSPLTYSVSSFSVPSFEPRLLLSHRVLDEGRLQQVYGSLDDLESASATWLLEAAGLVGSRPLVAFDMIERTETVPKKRKNNGDPQVTCARCKDGDRQLFSAFDNAVKAAFFWVQEDSRRKKPEFATLNVPVFVLLKPFWDVCIDRGWASDPEVKHRGYQSLAYPSERAFKEVMALVWDQDEISGLALVLDGLFVSFQRQMTKVQAAMS